MDGKEYKIRHRTEQMVQALKSGLHYPPVDIEKEVEGIYAMKASKKEAMAAIMPLVNTKLRMPLP
ncbi:MAG: hypothetical protein IJ411_04010, partial [Oscillospiraceae bacterium]|nr:hypothetical protein [Oscillospiraceae bacterium]